MIRSMAIAAMTGLRVVGGTDILYGGDGSDYLRGDILRIIGSQIFTGGEAADIFVLNTADSGIDTIADFTPSDGDKIRMEAFDGTMPKTIDAFLAAANLRVKQRNIKANEWNKTLTDDPKIANTAIYKVVDGADDVLVMVLEDSPADPNPCYV